MDGTANRLTDQEIRQHILDGTLCPFPRPSSRPHLEDNTELVNALSAMSREQQQAWLAERRKQRAILLASLTEQ